MSERFKYYFPSQIINDKKTGQRYYGNKPLAELLNELHEENKELRLLVDTLKEQNMKFKLRLNDLGVEYL